jgi:hypothetical protein
MPIVPETLQTAFPSLESLRVIHLPKGKSALAHPLDAPKAFSLDSCQRVIWVFPSPEESAEAEAHVLAHSTGAEVYGGADAYRFLLRVATGLESEVRGETDVFGQLKLSWSLYEQAKGAYLESLHYWMQRLFEDTKDIRAAHLQKVGGTTYGGLVRKLLRKFAPSKTPTGPILLVGAGQIAHGVAPWLADHELWLLNRDSRKLEALQAEILARNPAAKIRLIENGEDEKTAWQDAHHIVLCIPVDADSDLARIEKLGTRAAKTGRVIHLGGLMRDCGAWKNVPQFHSLDDLFVMREAQNQERSAQFERALRACDERARLRSLAGHPGGSVTLPHGWEDLLAFA